MPAMFATPVPPVAPRPRVLVVDDQADAADALGLLLDELGYDTSVAYGALEAVQQATRFLPDLVMVDLHMPRIDGFDTARAIRACRLPSQPVLVAVTGDIRADTRRAADEAGFDYQLLKPTPQPLLEAVMRRALAAA